MFDRDLAFPFRRKFRNELRHPIFQPEFLTLDQQHDCRRAGDDLGQRRRVKNGILGHRLFGGHERALAEGFDAAQTTMLNPQHAAGAFLVGNGFVDGGVHLRQFVRAQVSDPEDVGLGESGEARQGRN